jgi:UDP-N-acetylmuramyl tripeptide synthase
LTGPNLVLPGPGAILDVLVEPADQAALSAAWRRAVLDLHAALGRPVPTLNEARFAVGMSLAFSSPIDVLYAATELNEAALLRASAEVEGRPLPEAPLATLRGFFERQSRPRLLALEAAARERGLGILWDEEVISIGHGAGCLKLDRHNLPNPSEVDWSRVHEVPCCLVTGTNGKSTTVRLVAAMAAAAGKVAGLCSTDWVRVGAEVLDRGDYSGPGGARLVLRDPRTEVAVLETARGGIQRRGLALQAPACTAVLNVTPDHLGEWGSWDLEELADIKMVLARAVRPGGRAVLNAEDPRIVARSRGLAGQVLWFALNPEAPALAAARAKGQPWAALIDGELWLSESGRTRPIQRADRIPCALYGAARHNLANALVAIALGNSLGLSDEAMAEGLERFGQNPDDNPGRLVLFDLGGLKALVDFAHNPDGQVALLDTAKRLGAKRTLVVLGQAGDRDNASILELVRVTVEAKPDRIVIKEMQKYLRGRAPGEVPALIENELLRLGYPPQAISHAGSEAEALEQAVTWGQPGDVLLMFSHADRSGSLARLAAARDAGWRPGQPWSAVTGAHPAD